MGISTMASLCYPKFLGLRLDKKCDGSIGALLVLARVSRVMSAATASNSSRKTVMALRPRSLEKR